MNASFPYRKLSTIALLSSALAAAADELPRTSWGTPSLQGYYTNATIVPLERPVDLGEREFLTEEEAQARLERAMTVTETQPGTEADVHYQFDDYGMARAQNQTVFSHRSSIITSPKNGCLPPATPEALARGQEIRAWRAEHGFDSAKERSLSERCIIWAHEGPPLLPTGYNNHVQIMESKNHIVIMSEMIHDARVIPIRDSAPTAVLPPQWQGSSWGHWEGDTLVIETTGFSGRVTPTGAAAPMAVDAKVVERISRIDAETLKYEFTVNDPTLWEAPWSGDYVMQAVEGPVFEYACHEGNYGLPNNLSGARAIEAKGGKP